MSNIKVISTTQRIVIDPATSSISVINAGPPGPSGSGEGNTTILNGVGAPTSVDGELGDYYLDTAENVLYGPKGVPDTIDYEVVIAGTNIAIGTTGYTVGTKFSVTEACSCTGILFSTYTGETGLTGWKVKLYRMSDEALLSSTTTGAIIDGVNRIDFSSPVDLNSGVAYIASYWNPATSIGFPYYNSHSAAIDEGPIHIFAPSEDGTSAAVYSATDSYPGTDNGSSQTSTSTPMITAGTSAWPIAIEGGGPSGGLSSEDAVDVIADALVGGTGIDITYDDALNEITIDAEGFVGETIDTEELYRVILFSDGTVRAIPDSATAPAIPASFDSAPRISSVTLTWAAAAGAASYRVYRDGIFLAATANRKYRDGTVVVGETYDYTVQSVSAYSLRSGLSTVETAFIDPALNIAPVVEVRVYPQSAIALGNRAIVRVNALDVDGQILALTLGTDIGSLIATGDPSVWNLEPA